MFLKVCDRLQISLFYTIFLCSTKKLKKEFQSYCIKQPRLLDDLCTSEGNRGLEFQDSLKLKLNFKVFSRSRLSFSKVSRVFKFESNSYISRENSSWPGKTLNFKARMRIMFSRVKHFKARVEPFKSSRNFQGISRNPWNLLMKFFMGKTIWKIFSDLITMGTVT